jgi:hypothetical protein
VRRVTVSVLGKDRETHAVEVDAASLFDAAEKALQQWAMLLASGFDIVFLPKFCFGQL